MLESELLSLIEDFLGFFPCLDLTFLSVLEKEPAGSALFVSSELMDVFSMESLISEAFYPLPRQVHQKLFLVDFSVSLKHRDCDF